MIINLEKKLILKRLLFSSATLKMFLTDAEGSSTLVETDGDDCISVFLHL